MKISATGTGEDDVPQGFGKPNVHMKSTYSITQNSTMDIKHLGNTPVGAGGEEQPKDTKTDGKPTETGKPNPVVMRFTKTQAKWASSGQ